ncbi:MAG: GDP-mannose pyrophosphatase NudK [Bacteroidota bacterium]|nr:GDP-mannose pyrophosphatase NudK [Bacteroidota bacterium]
MTPSAKIVEKKLLSDNWYKLYKYTFDVTDEKGETRRQTREAYDRGNGAVILLYNKPNKTVMLTRQFRLPTFVNGNPDGMMIEACAGLLDQDDPEDCIRRETEEETGYRIEHVEKIYEAYMSPGSVTEILHFFVGEYSKGQKVNEGGGVDDEQENIEVLELAFDKAWDMIGAGEIRDAKTIMLLQYARLNFGWAAEDHRTYPRATS